MSAFLFSGGPQEKVRGIQKAVFCDLPREERADWRWVIGCCYFILFFAGRLVRYLTAVFFFLWGGGVVEVGGEGSVQCCGLCEARDSGGLLFPSWAARGAFALPKSPEARLAARSLEHPRAG